MGCGRPGVLGQRLRFTQRAGHLHTGHILPSLDPRQNPRKLTLFPTFSVGHIYHVTQNLYQMLFEQFAILAVTEHD